MADGIGATAWRYRGLYVGLTMVILFLQLLPLSSAPGRLPGPDLLLCLTIAWVMRRPDYLPALLIALVVLTEDFLVMRPPGLWAVLTVLACEFLRARQMLTRELTFPVEWLLVVGVMLAMLLAYRMVSALALVPQPSFGLAFVQFVWTAAAYPLALFLSQLAFGLHKPAMGELDDRGRRL